MRLRDIITEPMTVTLNLLIIQPTVAIFIKKIRRGKSLKKLKHQSKY